MKTAVKEKLSSFLCLFSRKRQVDARKRVIYVNDSEKNVSFGYVNNHVKTSKYNIITFLPKNLWEQFQRVANIYFLGLLILQLMPVISSLSPFTTIVPLSIVLAITAIKDAIDDIQRCRCDREVNKRLTLVLVDGHLEDVPWDKVCVGDIVYMSNDESIVADLFIISTSESSGLCYIDTAELDGETNLKVKQALMETATLKDDLRALSNFRAVIECEPPNNRLNRFEGQIQMPEKTVPISDQNVLLRGWSPRFKQTEIDRMLNSIILRIMVGYLITCFTLSVLTMIFEGVYGYSFTVFAPWEKFAVSAGQVGGSIILGLLNWFSYMIVLNTVVPISLYVSIEIIRLFQSKLIDWDLAMYDETDDVAAKARTTTLNEQLGKVQYIFSDKTGTLTQNIMTFVSCSIYGSIYGLREANELEGASSQAERSATTTSDFVELPHHEYSEESFKWRGKQLIEKVSNKDKKVIDFMLNLALCHTVMSELKHGSLTYQAQSPDESALVSAARNFGIVFLSRTSNTITVKLLDSVLTYDVLNILDFNNVRKRMSIIVREKGSSHIYLYCKGADSMLKPLLCARDRGLWATTDAHMNEFGSNGLRTLCLAKKAISMEEYERWNEQFIKASLSLENREEKLGKVYEKIETDLELMGATAIEDKLQDGVPSAIRNLLRAQIRVWVLTGDKLETAINIGLSCRLLSDAMDLQTLEEDDEEEIKRRLLQIKEYMIAKVEQAYSYIGPFPWDWLEFSKILGDRINSPSDDYFDGFALAISGESLVHALSPKCKDDFLDVSCFCKSVICCRATPLQKAQVVNLLKKGRKAITLAIGDGANDVSMIQAAHIGVGISGREGRQAVLASDYSIGQFRYIERLLLVHGRWSYLRVCKFLQYFFYKNFAFTFCNFWYAFFCGISAQTLFDPFYIATYNVFFSSMPVFAMGILEQDINAQNSLRSPQLYPFGQTNAFFNWSVFICSILYGLITSTLIFFLTYFSFHGATLPNGVDEADLQSLGCAVAVILTIVVNLEIAMETYYWTGITHFYIWGTIVVCFLFHYFLYGIDKQLGPISTNKSCLSLLYSTTLYAWFKFQYKYIGVAQTVFGSFRFWIVCAVTCCYCIVPRYAYRAYVTSFHPSKMEEVRYKQKYGFVPQPIDIGIKRKLQLGRNWFRSGYAFSHSEGFGNLIKGGVMFKRVFEVLDSKRSEGSTSSINGKDSTGQSSSLQTIDKPGTAAIDKYETSEF